jgi:hypothetical protein
MCILVEFTYNTVQKENSGKYSIISANVLTFLPQLKLLLTPVCLR